MDELEMPISQLEIWTMSYIGRYQTMKNLTEDYHREVLLFSELKQIYHKSPGLSNLF